MELKTKIDPRGRAAVVEKAGAGVELCWTCRCCTSECPLHIATGCLDPARLVRLANFGLLEDLLRAPAVWYCQSCNRCAQVCPAGVRPLSVIHYARTEAVMRRRISPAKVLQIREIFGRFQRVRFQAACACLDGRERSLPHDTWEQLLAAQPQGPGRTWADCPHAKVYLKNQRPKNDFGAGACFTCSECTNACPIFYERAIFDPQWIFRMANLGLEAELLRSPAIWLCIGCQRCTRACSQLVKGHLVIEKLQHMAVTQGHVRPSFPLIWKDAGRRIYPHLVRAIDCVLSPTPEEMSLTEAAAL